MPGSPFFARFYDMLMRPVERRLLGAMRARLLAGLRGEVLEVGTGTGVNFPLFATEPVTLTATEPDARMATRGAARAKAAGLDVRFVPAPAEALPFEDGAFDAVVATLVLCSVEDPARALSEIRRVLRPGGELRFLEHVRGEGAGGRVQDWLRPAWAWLGAGCQLNRRTGEDLRRAGFVDVQYETVAVPFPLLRLIVGTARRP